MGVLSHDAVGLITFYNAMFADRGFVCPPHMVAPARMLSDKRIRNGIIVIGPGSSKSTMFSVVHPAFEIGQDPTQTFLNISAGEGLVQGFQSAVGDWIKNSPIYRAFFPDVYPDEKAGWSSEKGLFVAGHRSGDPDSNYFACGLTSKQLTGKHARNVFGDDLHDRENSASFDACLKVQDTYYNTLIGRADPSGARFMLTGRRWHDEDILGHLEKQGTYVVMSLPAERPNSRELYWDVTIPKGIICDFTEGSQSMVNVQEHGGSNIKEV